MRVATIIGARPQFVKAAVVSPLLRAQAEEILINTGQHYDYELSKVFFEDLTLPAPDYDLGIGSDEPAAQVGRMLVELEQVLGRIGATRVLVYGDTNSTLAGALAATLRHLPVSHIEAGLRSYNRAMPEETNRVLTDHVADQLFCPTVHAAGNLAAEGVTRGVAVVGDVMYDAVQARRARMDRGILDLLGLAAGAYCLATIHRKENVTDPARLAGILDCLGSCPWPIVFPIHPGTRRALATAGIRDVPPGVQVIDPVRYPAMLALEAHARRIITDSGGVQKEAYFLGVPCITMRGETEWVETLAGGWNSLVDTDRDRFVEALHREPVGVPRPDLFGDGTAGARIAELVKNAE